MFLQSFPWYCGGRILLGMTPIPFESKNHFDQTLNASGGNYNSYCPKHRGDFAYLLDQLFEKNKYIIGTVVAVTNRSQEEAGKLLADLGFVMAADTDKSGNYGKCKTWVGDVRIVVRNRIIEVLKEEGEKIGLKSYLPAHLRPKDTPKPKPAPKKISLFSDRDV